MSWGCIGPNGVRKLAASNKPMNAENYVSLLQNNSIADVDPISGTADKPIIFQQDNASPQRDAYAKNIFLFKGLLFCLCQHKILI